MDNKFNKLIHKIYRVLLKRRDVLKSVLTISFIIVTGIVYVLCSASNEADKTGSMDVIQADTDLKSASDYENLNDEDLHDGNPDGENLDDAEGDNMHSHIKLDMLYVYVCGAVNNPGVYNVRSDYRIYQVIELAGGLAEGANETYLNMVDCIKDGQKIYVPYEDEAVMSTDGESAVLKVNINTASEQQLMSLPGIGKSKALDIIKYRNENGKFNSIEDIMKISGIKEAAFLKIKELICV